MNLGWHVISGEDLLAALRRVQAGETADMVLAELWANAQHEAPKSTTLDDVLDDYFGTEPKA